jgi:hypothetical protein
VRVIGALELPTASTPRTENVCWRSSSPDTCTVGGAQEASVAPSSVQTRLPSLVDTPKSAAVVLVVEPSVGPLRMWTTGGVVSTFQVRTAGVVSTLPDGSTARTLSCHVPFWARLLNVAPFFGHAPNAPMLPGGSSRHWNVASGSLGAENDVKVADVWPVVLPLVGPR